MDIHQIVSNDLLESLADWEDYLKAENLDPDALLADLAAGVAAQYVPTYLLDGGKPTKPIPKKKPRKRTPRRRASDTLVPPVSGGPA